MSLRKLLAYPRQIRRLTGGSRHEADSISTNSDKGAPLKKSLAVERAYRDPQYEICQYVSDYIISCACVTLHYAGAFFVLADLETHCPKVGTPGCRSPPGLRPDYSPQKSERRNYK